MPDGTPQKKTPRDLAVNCLQRAKGDPARARDLLRSAILRNDSVLRDIVNDIAANLIGWVASQQRQAAQRSVTLPPADQRGDRVSTYARSLLDFPLPCSLKPLGVATFGEVEEAANYYVQKVAEYSLLARWLKSVSDAAPTAKDRAKKVGDVLSIERINALYVEAKQ